MSNEELKDTLDALKALRGQLDTPAKSLAFLVRAGIVTPTGELTEPYKQHA